MAARKKPTGPAASPLGVAQPGNPEAEARARRRVEVEAVLRMLREELPALERANRNVDRFDLLGSLHRKYEQEHQAIVAGEEAIDAAK